MVSRARRCTSGRSCPSNRGRSCRSSWMGRPRTNHRSLRTPSRNCSLQPRRSASASPEAVQLYRRRRSSAGSPGWSRVGCRRLRNCSAAGWGRRWTRTAGRAVRSRPRYRSARAHGRRHRQTCQRTSSCRRSQGSSRIRGGAPRRSGCRVGRCPAPRPPARRRRLLSFAFGHPRGVPAPAAGAAPWGICFRSSYAPLVRARLRISAGRGKQPR
jgi:hypothetical protein